MFTAAAVQLRSGLSPSANLAAAEDLIRAAVGSGADYVLTPEMTNVLDARRDRLLKVIEPEAAEPSLARYRALAAELGIVLHIASLAIKLQGDRVANRGFVIGRDGAVIARYDKIHMFDADLGGGESYRESRLYQAGDQAVAVDLPFVRLGLSICYDVRFAYLYRALAKAGASLMAVPAAFASTTGQAHWHVLLRARAIETGSFVAAAAQGGHHENGRQTYGHSMIIDPWGEILAEADDTPGYILARIDPAASDRARARIPVLAGERPVGVPTVAGAVTIGEAV